MNSWTRTSGSSPYGDDTQRYWDRRHALFSRFDRGILTDREGLVSAKPEAIALGIARKLPGQVALDAFCGVGGSAIALAHHKAHVIAVDTSGERLAMAKHNAALYGVDERIEFLQRDIRDVLLEPCRFDCIYLDPPWGGSGYSHLERFTLEMFQPSGRWLLTAALQYGCPFALTVPKNFDLHELSDCDEPFELEWNEMDGERVFATAYFRLGKHR